MRARLSVKYLLRIVFCLLLPLVLLLLSYKITAFVWQFTPSQEKVIDFLYHHQNFEGATSLEMSHLEDVRVLMNKINWFFWIGVICLIGIITYSYQNMKEFRWLSLYGGIATVSFITLFILGVVFGFSWLFTGFHEIFFPQGNWLFPYDSFLISNFPFDFFEKITTVIILQTFLWGSLFIGIALYLKYGFTKNN